MISLVFTVVLTLCYCAAALYGVFCCIVLYLPDEKKDSLLALYPDGSWCYLEHWVTDRLSQCASDMLCICHIAQKNLRDEMNTN